MDFSKVKWTNVKLQYNRQKNQWQMVYSAKAIPLGKDDDGILRYKPVRKPVSIPIPLGFHRNFDPETKQDINLPRHKKDHNKDRVKELKLLEAHWQVDLTNQIYHLNQNKISGEKVYGWALNWISNQTLAKNTVDGYKVVLNKMKAVEDVHFLSFDTSFINRFIKHLNQFRDVGKLEQTSIRTYYERLKFILEAAERDNKIYEVETMFQKADNVPYGESEIGCYFSLEQLRILHKHESNNPIIKRAFLFGCLTGLRFNEIMELTWKDVKEKDGKLTLDVKNRKNKQSQVIPLTKEALEYAGERREINDKVFLALTYSDINNKLTEWVNSSGIEVERVKTHDARRTCAYLIWNQTKNIDTCAKFLNHKNQLETAKYLRKYLGDAFDSIDADATLPSLKI